MDLDYEVSTFILVHGTFARGASWTNDDSLLVRKLRQRFPHARIVPFLWSGKNAHSERIGAAEELAKAIEVEAARTKAPLFLIAHSHGGNVCLYASRYSRAPVTGIVCLATPFIDARPRNLAGPFANLRWTLALTRVGNLETLIMLATICFLAAVLPGDWGFVAAVIGAICVVGSAAQTFSDRQKAVDEGLKSRALREQEAIVSRLQLPPTDVPILAAYVRRDEAATWLRAWRRIGEIPHFGWSLANLALKALLPLALIAIIGAIAYEEAGGASDAQFLAMAIVFVILSIVILTTPMLALMAIFPWAVRGNRFVFGGEKLLDNLLVSIRAVVVPPGASRATGMAVDFGRGRGLRHSRLYSDGSLLDRVVDYCASLTRARRVARDRSSPPAPRPPTLGTPARDSVGVAAPAQFVMRNGPCPCGSGRRYKHCHGALA
jgi:hypothetical protein